MLLVRYLRPHLSDEHGWYSPNKARQSIQSLQIASKLSLGKGADKVLPEEDRKVKFGPKDHEIEESR